MGVDGRDSRAQTKRAFPVDSRVLSHVKRNAQIRNRSRDELSAFQPCPGEIAFDADDEKPVDAPVLAGVDAEAAAVQAQRP